MMMLIKIVKTQKRDVCNNDNGVNINSDTILYKHKKRGTMVSI